jgi:hypothetical protein
MDKTTETRFDLEDRIMACWQVVDDVGVVLDMFDRSYTEDELMNALIGIQTLYEQKFQNLFNTFSKHIETL